MKLPNMENYGNYLPKDDQDKLFWLKNFIDKLQEYSTSLGFSNSDTVIIEQDIQRFRSLLKIRIEYRHAQSLYGLRGPVRVQNIGLSRSGSVVSAQPQIPAWLYKRLAYAVKEIKDKPGYSEALGLELGLVRAGNTSNVSPDFTNVNSSIHINKLKATSHDH